MGRRADPFRDILHERRDVAEGLQGRAHGRHLDGRRASHLGGHCAVSRLRLHGLEDLRAIEPQARLGIARAELQRALEHFFCTVGVAAAEEHLPEDPVDEAIARRELPRADEEALGIREAMRAHVHPRDRHQHRHAARVFFLREISDLLDQRGVRRPANGIAQGNGRLGIGVSLPRA